MKLALAGDTMLGRGVADALARGSDPLSGEVAAAAAEADLFIVNLECCVSGRGERWANPDKPFFFRAPPEAAEVLARAGVDCVSLANNHALDFGEQALLDTFDHLERAGLAWVGAGPDLDSARRPLRLSAHGEELVVIACSDHPAEFAAGSARPGVAFADLPRGIPEWLRSAILEAAIERPVLVAVHWGPNMTTEPLPYVRAAATRLRESGAALIAGHSAHVFHGVASGVLFDLGDFVDDYAVDPALRNDLGLLFLVSFERGRPRELEGIPLKLDYCHTRLATGSEGDWVRTRFKSACEALGTPVEESDGRVLARLD